MTNFLLFALCMCIVLNGLLTIFNLVNKRYKDAALSAFTTLFCTVVALIITGR